MNVLIRFPAATLKKGKGYRQGNENEQMKCMPVEQIAEFQWVTLFFENVLQWLMQSLVYYYFFITSDYTKSTELNLSILWPLW